MEPSIFSKVPALATCQVRTLGIDPSLNSTGLSVFNNDKLVRCYRVKTGMLGIARIITIKDFIVNLIESQDIDVIGMEGYIYGSGMLVNNSFELHELGGVLKAAFFGHGITPYLFAPTTIKKFVTGYLPPVKRAKKGEPKIKIDKKKLMAEGIKKHWNLYFDSKKQNDIADAYAIGKFTYYLNCACVLDIDPKILYRGVLESYQLDALSGAYSRL